MQASRGCRGPGGGCGPIGSYDDRRRADIGPWPDPGPRSAAGGRQALSARLRLLLHHPHDSHAGEQRQQPAEDVGQPVGPGVHGGRDLVEVARQLLVRLAREVGDEVDGEADGLRRGEVRDEGVVRSTTRYQPELTEVTPRIRSTELPAG